VSGEPPQFEVPKGSVAVGRRVRIPRGAAEPIRVYINGIEQNRGSDYAITKGHVVFSRPILKEEKLKGIRKAVLLIGVIGNYVRDEHVDLEYRLEGATKLASDVAILPD
jgi:hypothetical protein